MIPTIETAVKKADEARDEGAMLAAGVYAIAALAFEVKRIADHLDDAKPFFVSDVTGKVEW